MFYPFSASLGVYNFSQLPIDFLFTDYSTDEASTYYADSTMYDGVSYKVFELDEDVLVWDDEGSYYLME